MRSSRWQGWTSRALVTALLLGSVPTARSQEPVGSIKAETTVVIVDVIVTDRKGKPITDIPQSAFRVFENDKEQKVTAFTAPPPVADVPVAPAAPPAGTAAATAAKPSSADDFAPNFVTIVLDLADNQPISVRRSCDAVIKYLTKTKAPNTAVAIYYTTPMLRLAVPFTLDIERAQQALDTMMHRTPPGQFTDRESVQEQINDLYLRANPEAALGGVPGAATNTVSAEQSRSGPGEPFAMAYKREIESLQTYLNMQNTFQAQSLFVALRALALSYREMPGRKNVVLFSEGFGFASAAKDQLDAVIEAANQANVSFYVIDPAGLETGARIASRGPNTRAVRMSEIAAEGIGQRGGESKFDRMRALGNEVHPHEQLGDLAHDTGGLLIRNTNDLGAAFSKVMEDSRNFYTLVYSPQDRDWKGDFRKIKVALARDGAQLRYRQGYWAIPRGQGFAMTPTQAHLYSSARAKKLEWEFQTPVRASVALAGDGKYYAPFSIAVPLKSLPTKEDLEEGKPGLTVVAFAHDVSGKLVSTYEKHWEAVRPGKVDDKALVTMQGQIPVPEAQSLNVQIVVQLPNGRFALGEGQAQLPMPSDAAPRLSSLMLTDHMEAAKCEDKSEALCVLNVRLRQPVVNRFKREAKLFAYISGAEITVDPQSKQPRVAAEFAVFQGEKKLGAVPAQNVQAFPGPKPGSAMFVAQINLKALPPGTYAMESTVHDLAQKTSSRRKMEFELE